MSSSESESSDSSSSSGQADLAAPAACKTAVLKALSDGCCKRNCLHKLPLQELIYCRELYARLGSQAAQRKFLCNLRLAAHWDGYHYRGDKICQRAFRQLYGVSQSKLRRIERSHSADIPRRQRKQARREHLRAFLTAFFTKNGERSPVNDEIHMPEWMAQKDVHRHYIAQLPEHCGKPLSLTSVKRLISAEFAHVKFPVEARFSKCSICTQLKEAVTLAHTDVDKALVQQAQDAHLDQQGRERAHYQSNQQLAAAQPAQCRSIAGDGSKAAELPHSNPPSKEYPSLNKLKILVWGLIDHAGPGAGRYIYFSLPVWMHNFDFYATVLVRHLQATLGSVGLNRLFLQADNTASQVKNRYMFGLAAWLIEHGVAREIEISFLLVGHTHIDIDQMFSTFWTAWRRGHPVKVTARLEKLLKFVRKYLPSLARNATVIDSVWAFRAFFEPHVRTFSGHSEGHVFRVARAASGEIQLIYKTLSTDPTWSGDFAESNGLPIWRAGGAPRGYPAYEAPIPLTTEDRDALAAITDKLRNPDDRAWWHSVVSQTVLETLNRGPSIFGFLARLQPAAAPGTSGQGHGLVALRPAVVCLGTPANTSVLLSNLQIRAGPATPPAAKRSKQLAHLLYKHPRTRALTLGMNVVLEVPADSLDPFWLAQIHELRADGREIRVRYWLKQPSGSWQLQAFLPHELWLSCKTVGYSGFPMNDSKMPAGMEEDLRAEHRRGRNQ